MKQTTKRFISMIVGLMLLVASIVVYTNFVRPAYSDSQEVKGQQLGQRIFLAEEQATIERVGDLISSYQTDEGSRQQQAVSLALPLEPDVDGAIAQVYGIAKINDLDLRSISVSAAGIRASDAPDERQFTLQKPVGRVVLSVSMVGAYENFKNFLEMLETNIRIFDVERLSLSSGAEDERSPLGIFGYSVTVVAYHQGE